MIGPVASSVFGSGAESVELGPGLGAGVDCELGARLVLGAGYDYHALEDVVGHYAMGSLGWRIPLNADGLELALHAEGGAGSLHPQGSIVLLQPLRGTKPVFEGVHPTIGGGLRLQGPVGGRWSWFADVSIRAAFVDVFDYAVGEVTYTTAFTTFPFSAGVRFGI